MSKYFAKPKSLAANVKVESDLSNYATKADLKNPTSVDTLDFAKKIDLANWNSDVDKLDIDKFKNVPSNLSKSHFEYGWLLGFYLIFLVLLQWQIGF